MSARTRQSLRFPARQGGRRRRAWPAAAAVAIGVMTLGVLAPPAASDSAAPAAAAARQDAVQRALNTLVRDDGMPAALGERPGPERAAPAPTRRGSVT
ncbi:hypothetical protein SMICM17S_03078 [Streptomyces microflavus]